MDPLHYILKAFCFMEINPTWNFRGTKMREKQRSMSLVIAFFSQSIINKYSKGTASSPFEKKTSKNKSQVL